MISSLSGGTHGVDQGAHHRRRRQTLRRLLPDVGVIADYEGPMGDLAELAERLASTPGVVEHGLFPMEMVATVLAGRGDSVDRRNYD